jgi:chemotaxis protein methyltransferase WspC
VIDERLSVLLREACGMSLETLGETVVGVAVASRARALGIPAAAYVARVTGDSREQEELLEELVVPETWFLRDGGPFAFLAERARQGAAEGRPVLRVLSVPCSTGEEPFSIAMTLLEAVGGEAPWSVEAIDISARALRRAAEGRYRAAALRSTPLALRERYFSERGGLFEVATALRERVRFSRGNALALPRPADAAGYDVIFCRNLFIYLSAGARERLAAALLRMLRPGGVLLMGHADFIGEGLGWARTGPSSAFAHAPVAQLQSAASAASAGPADPGRVAPLRAPPAGNGLSPLATLHELTLLGPGGWGAAEAPSSRVRLVEPRASGVPAVPARAPAQPPLPSPPALVERAPGHAAQLLDDARRMADRGELEAARSLCERHVEAAPLDAAGHCLLGVVLSAMGRRAAAEACFRRATYLEPRNDEALAHLAMLAQARGDAAQAAGFRRRRRGA